MNGSRGIGVFLIIQVLVCWLTSFLLLNLVHQTHQLETKWEYQRGWCKSIPVSHIKAAVQYGFQLAKWVSIAACSAGLKIAHPGAKSKQHYLKAHHSCWLLPVQSEVPVFWLYSGTTVTGTIDAPRISVVWTIWSIQLLLSFWRVLLKLNYFFLSWDLFLHWTAGPKNPQQLKKPKLCSRFVVNLLILL